VLRKREKKPIAYEVVESDPEGGEEEGPEYTAQKESFIEPTIEILLSRKSALDIDTEDDEETLYLVKFRNRSYHRCLWLNEEQLGQYRFVLDSTKRKGMFNRMHKLMKMKLGEGHHFNPSHLLPDRILRSTDLFAAIQPKKANQIKGTWQESLQLVCLKLLNFEKRMYPYGTLLLDEPNSGKESDVYSLPTVLNRIYFGLYPDYAAIWQDIGRAITNFLKDSK
jgi:hypothetical protein